MTKLLLADEYFNTHLTKPAVKFHFTDMETGQVIDYFGFERVNR